MTTVRFPKQFTAPTTCSSSQSFCICTRIGDSCALLTGQKHRWVSRSWQDRLDELSFDRQILSISNTLSCLDMLLDLSIEEMLLCFHDDKENNAAMICTVYKASLKGMAVTTLIVEMTSVRVRTDIPKALAEGSYAFYWSFRSILTNILDVIGNMRSLSSCTKTGIGIMHQDTQFTVRLRM